jgi:hypothetical protein
MAVRIPNSTAIIKGAKFDCAIILVFMIAQIIPCPSLTGTKKASRKENSDPIIDHMILDFLSIVMIYKMTIDMLIGIKRMNDGITRAYPNPSSN